jgi:hypothetical protein
MHDLKPREPAVRDVWPRNLYGHSAKNAARLGCFTREPAIDTFTLFGTGRGLRPRHPGASAQRPELLSS